MSRLLVRSFTVLVFLFLLMPIALVLVVSFNSSTLLSFPIEGFSFRWYQAFFSERDLVESLQTSVVIALVSTAVSLPLGLLAAFGIDRYRFPGRALVGSFFLSPLLVPHIVLGIGILLFYSAIGVRLALWGFIVAHVLITLPYVIRTVLANLARFDLTLEEAAMMLGANDLRTKLEVTLPLIRPGLLAGGIFAFMTSFDNVQISLFLAGPRLTPLPVRIYSRLETQGIDPIFTSISTILILATLAIILLLDRYVGLDYVRGRK